MQQAHATMAAMKPHEKLDVDIRFLLANERTLLAWIRTALTMQAGGIALAHFVSDSALGFATGLSAIIVGAVFAVIGYRRFRAADTAIRAGRLPRADKGPAYEVFFIVMVAVVLAIAQVRDIL
jgi:putative membrane protein